MRRIQAARAMSWQHQRPDALFRQSQDGLQFLLIPFTGISQLQHVTGQGPPPVSEGDPDLHTFLQDTLQFFGNPVLEGPVQLFQGNIYNDIGKFHFLPNSSRTSAISTRSSMGCLTPQIS